MGSPSLFRRRHAIEREVEKYFDGECVNESKERCCYDCGCDVGKKCVNNECVEEPKKVEEEAVQEEEEKQENAPQPIMKQATKDIEKNFEEKNNAMKEKSVVYIILGTIILLIGLGIWDYNKNKRRIF